jgi:hypothetical protein
VKRAALLPYGIWQAERRNAVTVLSRQIEQASRTFKHDLADALRAARRDVDFALRERAAAEIEEGMHMRYAHETCLQRAA